MQKTPISEVIDRKRRTLLKLTAASPLLAYCRIVDAESVPTADASFVLTRPDDLLDLQVNTHNLVPTIRRGGRSVTLRRVTEDAPAYLTFVFAPQHLLEEAILEGQPLKEPDQMSARFSHESQLVFEIPLDISSIPLTLDALVGWQNWSTRLPDWRSSEIPDAASSRIELPYRLFLQPGTDKPSWIMPPVPEPNDWEDADRTQVELWQAVLSDSDESLTPELDVHPIFSPDGQPSPRSAPADEQARGFLSSMGSDGPRARSLIVKTFSGRPLTCGGTPAMNQTVSSAKVLALSALGGWLRSDAEWQPPRLCELKEWQHYASYGRDHFVKIVYTGFLYPFGLKAVLVEQTERKPDATRAGDPLTAYLQQRRFIKLVPPFQVDYADLEMPFRPLRAITLETPPLDAGTPAYDNTICATLSEPAFTARILRIATREDRSLGLQGTNLDLIENYFRFAELDIASVSTVSELQRGLLRAAPKYEDWKSSVLENKDRTFHRFFFSDDRTCQPGDTTQFDALMFWPTVGGELFQFEFEGIDHDSNPIRFASPTIFVPDSETVFESAPSPRVGRLKPDVERALDESWATHPQRQANFSSLMDQRVAMAKSVDPGDTTLEVSFVDFRRRDDPLLNGNIVTHPFVARIDSYLATSPPIQAVVGDNSTRLQLSYRLSDGSVINPDPAAKNSSGVFASAIAAVNIATGERSSPKLDFAKNGGNRRSGGLASPTIPISGASRADGISGGSDVSQLLDDQQPLDDILDADAKFLGAVSLKTMLEATVTGSGDHPHLSYSIGNAGIWNDPPPGYDAGDGWSATVDQVAFFNHRLRGPNDEFWSDYPATLLTVNYDWATGALKEAGPFQPADDTRLSFAGTFETDLIEGTARIAVRGEVNDFAIGLPSAGSSAWVTINFDSVSFQAGSDQTTKFTPAISGVSFGNNMSFMQPFQDLLESLKEKGFRIEIRDSGISVTHGFKLAPTTLGAFKIEGIGFRYGILLPLDDNPLAFDFSFAERDDPFLMTAGVYSGGGFFATLLEPNDTRSLEIALEFGATVGDDFGIAKGIVRIMAGIYYKVERGSAILEGYVRSSGVLSIVSIGSLSLVIYVGMRYSSDTGSAQGKVVVRVKVKIGFVKIERRFTTEREVQGGSSEAAALANRRRNQTNVPFREAWSVADWTTYQSAFHGGAA